MPNVVDLDSLFGGGGGNVVDLDSLMSGSKPVSAPITRHPFAGAQIGPRRLSMTERLSQLVSDIWHTPGRMVDSAANAYAGIPTPLPSANDEEYQGGFWHAPNDTPAAQLAAEALVPEEEARRSYPAAAHRAILDTVLPFGTDPMNAAVGIGLQNVPSMTSRIASAGFAGYGAKTASEQARAAQTAYEEGGMSPEVLRESLSAGGNALLAGLGARHAIKPTVAPRVTSDFMEALNASLQAPQDMSPRLAPKRPTTKPGRTEVSVPGERPTPEITLSPMAGQAAPDAQLPAQSQVGAARPGTQAMSERLRSVDAMRRVAAMEQKNELDNLIVQEGQKMGAAGGQREMEAIQKRDMLAAREAEAKSQLEANVPSFARRPVTPEPQTPGFTIGNRGAYQSNTVEGVDTLMNHYASQGAELSHTTFGSEYMTAPDGSVLIRHVGPDGTVAAAMIKPNGTVADLAAVESRRGTSSAGRLLYSLGELGARVPDISALSPDSYGVLNRLASRMGVTVEYLRTNPEAIRDMVRQKIAQRRGNAGPGVDGVVAGGAEAPGTGDPGTGEGAGVLGPGNARPSTPVAAITAERLNPEARAQSVEADSGLGSGVPVGPEPWQGPSGGGHVVDLDAIASDIGLDPAPGTFPGAAKRAILPQEEVLRRIPGVGEQLYQHVTKYRTRADTLAGSLKARVLRATSDFAPEDWSQLIAAMNTGQVEGTSPKIQSAFSIIKDQVLTPLWNMAAAAGATEVQPKENFFPAMERKSGVSEPRPEPSFGQEQLKGNSVASLETSRISPTEALVQTPQVLDRYINDVSHRVAEAEILGPDMERIGDLIRNLPPDRRVYAQKALMRATGTEYIDQTGRNLGKLRRAKAIVALPFAGATQYGQVVPTIASGGVGNTVRALTKMFSSYPETQARAYESGALSPTLSGETLATNTGTSSGLYGIGTADMHMRILANETGLQLARSKGLSGQAALDFAREFANQTQYRTEAEKLPQWSTSPVGKTVTQFMPFGYRHAIYLKNMIESGNGAQVARYLALAPVVGYAVAAAKAGMKGYDPEDVTALDALRASGGGGAFEDLLNRMTSHDPALSLAGPVAENAHDLVDAVASGEPGKAAAATAATFVPGFGGQISREILAGNDENKLPTRPGWVGRLRDAVQERPSSTRATLRRLEEEQRLLKATRGQVDARYPKDSSSATLTPIEKLGKTQKLTRRAQVVSEVLDQLARGDVSAARRLLAKARREGFKNLTLENITAGRDLTSDTAP
jgi:hypothetical protein